MFFLVLACAALDADPCQRLNADLEACDAEGSFECSSDDAENAEVIACMADHVEQAGCPAGVRSYVEITGPAWEACGSGVSE